MFRTIRNSDRRTTRWKNGQGWTSEIALFPPDATLQTFDWRISLAGTDCDAAFSQFPDIDRTLLLLAGRLTLKIEGRPDTNIGSESPPFLFPGNWNIDAKLHESPIMDFNVMTRRGRFVHSLDRQILMEPSNIELAADVTAAVSLRDGVQVTSGPSMETLNMHDAILFEGPSSEPVNIRSAQSAEILIVRISRC